MKNPFDFNNNGKLDLVDFLVASELDPNNPLNTVPDDDEDAESEIIDEYNHRTEYDNEEYNDSSYEECDSNTDDYNYNIEDIYNIDADADIFDMDSGDYENWSDSLNK